MNRRLFEPADVSQEVPQIVLQSIQPAAEFDQVKPSDKALYFGNIPMVPVYCLGQRNLSDLLCFPHIFQVVDHGNIVGVVIASQLHQLL